MKNNYKFGGTILSTIIKILVMLAVIFMLLWLFPTKQSLNPIYEEIFNNNLNAMKEAAESYYINSRLPENIGDSVTITLGEMLDKKLLLPFVDRYNKECDLTKSYVTITRTELDYEMKVNLVCSKESNYIIYHMGCTNKCAILGDGTDKKEITEYQFKKTTTKKVVDSYTCPKGYDLNDNNKCVKSVSSTKKVSATPVYDETSVSIDPIETEKTIPATYSNWSDWSSEIEYIYGSVYKYNDGTSKKTYTNYKVPENSDVLKVENLTYSNKKEYEFRKSQAIYGNDESKPIYTTALYKVGSYSQKYYTVKGYKYFIDTTTNTVYSYTGTSNISYSTYVDSLPSNGNGNYYVVGIDFESCGSTCTLKPNYQIVKYTGVKSMGSVSTFENLRVEVDADEDVVEIPVYAEGKTFVGYEQKVIGYVYNCYMKYHTKSRTKTEAYTEIKLDCTDGYELQNNRCYSKKSEITGYTCNTNDGYVLKGKTCYKEVVSTETIKATPVYKTVSDVTYEWSTSKKLDGYTLTGKTRTKIVEKESSSNNSSCECSCN